MNNKLEFTLKLNGNNHNVSVKQSDEDGYVVKLDNVDTAVIKQEGSCWVQIHGSKLPHDFIDEIGKQIIKQQ